MRPAGIGDHNTNEQFAMALTKSRGRVAIAAQYLGCTHQTVYNRLKKYPELREIREEARTNALDIAEDKLFSAVERDEPWAIKFFLSTQGKDRGYTEKFDVDSKIEHSGKVEHEMSEERAKLVDRLEGIAARLKVVPDDPFA